MNKEHLYRKDINTYKSKYFLYCNFCRAEKEVKRFGELDLKSYISRIKIEDK